MSPTLASVLGGEEGYGGGGASMHILDNSTSSWVGEADMVETCAAVGLSANRTNHNMLQC